MSSFTQAQNTFQSVSNQFSHATSGVGFGGNRREFDGQEISGYGNDGQGGFRAFSLFPFLHISVLTLSSLSSQPPALPLKPSTTALPPSTTSTAVAAVAEEASTAAVEAMMAATTSTVEVEVEEATTVVEEEELTSSTAAEGRRAIMPATSSRITVEEEEGTNLRTLSSRVVVRLSFLPFFSLEAALTFFPHSSRFSLFSSSPSS
jgi:hypothetical protein